MPHWRNEPLRIRFNDAKGYACLRRADAMGFLECFLDGSVDLEGNLYVLADVKNHLGLELRALRGLVSFARNTAFQTRSRAQRNVRSHYDVPQRVLDAYLDKTYRSYTCAVFADPEQRSVSHLVRHGSGRDDTFDSLERAQWRKFRQSLDLLEFSSGQSILDIGTGYGGLLLEALSSTEGSRAVGWTHSANQVAVAGALKREFGDRCEIMLGDYREERRRFDTVASIGMVSHVGPRGLAPYVRRVRDFMKPGGRYLHHDLMIAPGGLPQNLQVGPAFNKRYVWPGFHWFELATHIRELERAGFRVLRVDDLSAHYAKTTAAWYERMLVSRQEVARGLGEAGFRAWQIFLAGITGSLDNGGVGDYRIVCEAIDKTSF